MPVDEKLLAFIDRLREAGIAVSLAETIDAFEAFKVVPLDCLPPLYAALRSTLVKSESDFPVFDAVFEEFFKSAVGPYGTPGRESGAEPADPAQAPGVVMAALMGGSADDVAAAARMAAAAVGGMEGGFGGGSRPLPMTAGTGYYMFKGMELLDFGSMSRELERMAEEGELGGDVPPALALEALRERLALFRREMEREIRRLVAEERGSSAVTRRKKVPARPEEIDFMYASLSQVDEMRRVLPALSRKLAARIARRNSAGRRGKVDVRNTLRHSLSSGGVPLDLKYRKRIPYRPEIWILCDVSGSVRTFSTFTLQLVYSLHQQFKAVRSFAFIDRCHEVTDYFREYDVADAVARVYREANVVDGEGHSDIGRALEMFDRKYASEMGARATVLVLSDARNNARDPRTDALERIGHKARRIYWLNPESMEKWDSGDSVMGSYEQVCNGVQECRNLKQLADFVYRRT